MSEYQYYEFRAVDQPLDIDSQKKLRGITSRGEITSTSLTCVYNYGDFKGSPVELMKKYFDGHVYVTNWGTRRLMLKLPLALPDKAAIEPFLADEVVELHETKTHRVIDFNLNEEEGGDGWEEGEGWLGGLLRLRDELMAGDLRCLYLGWLAGVGLGMVGEDAIEPPVPAGLKRLTATQVSFVEFCWLDPHLLGVAAEASEDELPPGDTPEDTANWLDVLEVAEKDAMLARLMNGEGAKLTIELRSRFRLERAKSKGPVEPSAKPRRTAGELVAATEQRAEQEKQRKAELAAVARAELDRKNAALREARLVSLVGREDELWQQAETAVASRSTKQYDHAIEVINDLRGVATLAGGSDAFVARLRALLEKHKNKKTFVARFKTYPGLH